MIVVIVAALFGSLVGLAVRNGFVALSLAAMLTGFLQFLAMVFVQMLLMHPEHAILAQRLQAIVGGQLIGLAPNMVAAGAAAILSALIMSKTQTDQMTGLRLPDGERAASPRNRDKRVDHGALVEDRAIHDAARSRMDKIMRR